MAFCSMNSFNRIVHKRKVVTTATTIVYGAAPTDYVAYIAVKASFWIANTTKDNTNTYTLFADSISMTNDASRGYVINTGTGNVGTRMESPAQQNFCPSYTYSVWIKITSALSNVNNNGIVGDYLASSSLASFYLYISPTGVLTVTHGSSYNTDILTGSTLSALNVWSHIGITYNNTSKLITMYVNGVSVASKTKSTTWTGVGTSNAAKISFGYTPMAGLSFTSYTGLIDNMRVYSRDVTATEMLNIYGFESQNPTSGYFVTPLPTLFTSGITSSSVTIASFTAPNLFRNGTYNVSASSVLNNGTGFACYNAFNGLTTGGNGYSWVAATDGANPWIQIQLPFNLIASEYSLLPWSGTNGTNAPTDWYIYGSNNGTTWNTLDHKTVSTTYWTSYRVISFPISSNTTSYSYFRLQIIAASVNGGYPGIGQFNIG